jgi:predicted Zn-dependent peptidase
MRRLNCLFLLVTSLSGLLVGSDDAQASTVEVCFPSGLKVAATERRGRPLVGIATVIGGGSASEKPNERGAAHLLEHLWFRAPSIGEGSVSDTLSSVGANSNAYTSHDETIYVSIANRRAIRTLLELEVKRLQEPTAPAHSEHLDVERNVVLQETLLRTDGSRSPMSGVFSSVVAYDHPYAYSVAGSPDEINRLTSGTLQSYAARTYVPSNTSILLEGDFDASELIKLVRQVFPSELVDGKVPGETLRRCAEKSELAVSPPTPPANNWKTVTGGGLDEMSALLAVSFPPGAVEAHNANLLAEFIEKSLARRAFRFYSRCGALDRAQLGVLYCEFFPRDAEAAKELGPRLERIIQRTLSATTNGSSSVRGDLWSVIQRGNRRNNRVDVSEADALDLNPEGYFSEAAIRFHRTATPTRVHVEGNTTDVVRFGTQWWEEGRARGVVLVPAEANASAQGTVHGTRTGSRSPITGEVTKETLEGIIVPPDLESLKTQKLDNDIRLWTLTQPSQQTRYALVVPVDATTQPHVGMLALDLLVVPTRDFQGGVIDAYEARGAWVFEGAGFKSPTQADALYDHLLLPQPNLLLRPSDLRTSVKLLEARARKMRRSTEGRAALARFRAMSPNVPHWLDQASIDAIDNVARKDVKQWLARNIRPDNAVWISVENRYTYIPRTDHRLASGEISRWQGAQMDSVAQSVGAAVEAQERQVVFLEQEDEQSLAIIDLECRIDETNPTASWIIADAIQGALDDSLRNETGLTYAVATELEMVNQQQILHINTSVGHANVGNAVTAVLALFDQASSGGLSEDTLNRLKLSVARNTATRWQTSSEVLNWLVLAAVQGKQPTEMNLAADIAAVTPTTLATTLAPCVGREVVTVIGDKLVVGEALDEANLDDFGTTWRILPSDSSPLAQ